MNLKLLKSMKIQKKKSNHLNFSRNTSLGTWAVVCMYKQWIWRQIKNEILKITSEMFQMLLPLSPIVLGPHLCMTATPKLISHHQINISCIVFLSINIFCCPCAHNYALVTKNKPSVTSSSDHNQSYIIEGNIRTIMCEWLIFSSSEWWFGVHHDVWYARSDSGLCWLWGGVGGQPKLKQIWGRCGRDCCHQPNRAQMPVIECEWLGE